MPDLRLDAKTEQVDAALMEIRNLLLRVLLVIFPGIRCVVQQCIHLTVIQDNLWIRAWQYLD